MNSQPDNIVLCTDDAVALGELLFRSGHAADAKEANEALTDKLYEATIVEARALPEGSVRLYSSITYEEHPSGTRRHVTLVNPRQADAGRGRISVFSPIGRALLGQRRNRMVEVALPAGRRIKLHVLDATAPDPELAAEAIA
jgi:regulator of nucleoside diphosphate kinase